MAGHTKIEEIWCGEDRSSKICSGSQCVVPINGTDVGVMKKAQESEPLLPEVMSVVVA